MSNSMIETAHRFLETQSEPVPFGNLYNQVSETLNFTKSQYDKNIAHFFSDLSLDPRFISRPNNCWDLQKRHSTQDNKIDLDAISLEDEEEEALEELEEELVDEKFDESDEEHEDTDRVDIEEVIAAEDLDIDDNRDEY